MISIIVDKQEGAATWQPQCVALPAPG